MKALIIRSTGAPFELVEVPRPEPAAGEVLVRVRASGVNLLDTRTRAGKAAHARHPFPAILGIDLAGTVEAVGSGVTSWRRGDDVRPLAVWLDSAYCKSGSTTREQVAEVVRAQLLPNVNELL